MPENRGVSALASLWCGGALLVLASVGGAQEAQYPRKGNIEITVLFPAGSSADVTARLLADGIARQLSADVIVINRPGAGGAIGYRYVAGQRPDGYSLVWNSNSISTTHYSGILPLTYEAFEAVARVLVESPVIAVKADAKWKSLGELIAGARAGDGRFARSLARHRGTEGYAEARDRRAGGGDPQDCREPRVRRRVRACRRASCVHGSGWLRQAHRHGRRRACRLDGRDRIE